MSFKSFSEFQIHLKQRDDAFGNYQDFPVPWRVEWVSACFPGISKFHKQTEHKIYWFLDSSMNPTTSALQNLASKC